MTFAVPGAVPGAGPAKGPPGRFEPLVDVGAAGGARPTAPVPEAEARAGDLGGADGLRLPRYPCIPSINAKGPPLENSARAARRRAAAGTGRRTGSSSSTSIQ